MKKITIKFCLLCCAAIFVLHSKGQISQGVITLGGSGSQSGNSIIQTNDGGYAIAGYTNSYGVGDYDMYAVKLDKSGNEQWAKTIGGADSDAGTAIVQANDGGYVIAGSTNSFGAGETDVYVIKLDASGNLLWTKTIGGPLEDYGQSVAKTYDGGYAIAGYTASYGAGGYDVYVVKLDSAGNLLWTRTVGTDSNDYGYSIVQTNDKGLAIAGTTYEVAASRAYVVKLDSAGNLLWTTITPPVAQYYTNMANSIAQSADGDLVIGGFGTFGFMANAQGMIVKLSSSGSVLWAKGIDMGGVYSGVNCITSSLFDDATILAGNLTGPPFRFPYYSWTSKIDSDGVMDWCYIMSGSVSGLSIVSTPDKGFAMTGIDSTLMLFMKLDSMGTTCIFDSAAGSVSPLNGIYITAGVAGSGGITGSGGTADTGFSDYVLCTQVETGINSPSPITQSISVFPNPSDGMFNIHSSACLSAAKVEVYNEMGEMVYCASPQTPKGAMNEIDLRGQPNGVYFYRVSNEQGGLVGEGKLVIGR